jgi:hypothetical protein
MDVSFPVRKALDQTALFVQAQTLLTACSLSHRYPFAQNYLPYPRRPVSSVKRRQAACGQKGKGAAAVTATPSV